MRTFFVRYISFFTILFALCWGLDIYFSSKIPLYHTDKSYWLLRQKKTNYDFAVIGSSGVNNCIDVALIEDQNKIKGINLGLAGSDFTENYLVFNYFLKNNTIERLLINVDLSSFDSLNFNYPFHDYRYFPFLNDKAVFETMYDVVGLKAYVWRYLPFVKYVEFNKQLQINNFRKHSINNMDYFKKYFDKNRGSALLDKTNDFVFSKNILNKEYLYLSKSRVKYLEKMIKLAKRNNIQVEFFNNPSYLDYNNKIYTNHLEIENLIAEISKKYSIEYYHFNSYFTNSQKKYFYDYGHLNSVGAKIFSKALSDSMSN